MEEGQAVWLTKRKGAQQQSVDYAENTCVGSNADSQGRYSESYLPGSESPEAESVPDVLKQLARNLHRKRDCSRVEP